MKDVLEKGLPANVDVERLVLGSILLDGTIFVDIVADMQADNFSLEKHRKIYSAISALSERRERIDRVTVAEELRGRNQLEACDGIGYLVSLDDGLPRIPNLGAYVRILREKAMLRRIIYTSRKVMDRCLIGGEDVQQILGDAKLNFIELAESAPQEDSFQSVAENIENMSFADLTNQTPQTQGLYTEYADLDRMTGGLQAGEVFLLAARPRMGKTGLALNIARKITKRTADMPPDAKLPVVALFSMEMTKKALIQRLLCSDAGVNLKRLREYRTKPLTAEEQQKLLVATQRLASSGPIYIDDTPALTPAAIATRLARLRRRTGRLDAVMIDYVQRMMADNPDPRNRNAELSAISGSLKTTAEEMNVPFFVLSQLNRACEQRGTKPADKRPILSDLRDSGSLEQDADVIAFLFRQYVYDRENRDLERLAELDIAKQRNGPEGTIKLLFFAETVTFDNFAGTEEDEKQD